MAVILISGTASAEEGSWDIEKVSENGTEVDMAFDSEDTPHIAYTDNEGLKYISKNGSSWNPPETVELYNGAYSFSFISISPDEENQPHILYSVFNQNIRHAYRDKSGWNIESVPNTDSGLSNSMEFDSTGKLHISYVVIENYILFLRYNTKTGSSWGDPETVDSEIAHGSGNIPSISIDNEGNPNIAYVTYEKEHHTSSYESFAYKDVDGWHYDYYKLPLGHSWGFSSLALDSNGYPHISFAEYIDNLPHGTRLDYLYKDNNGWHFTVVDDNVWVGEYTSLALDSANNPHISYYDALNGALKYAYMVGGNWQIYTVDSDGNVGMYSSLVLDANDIPHIAYKGSVCYAVFVPLNFAILNQTVNAASNVALNSISTVCMQNTGLPLGILALSILMIFMGMVTPRKY